MSVLAPVPKNELGTTYTHYGWFAGLCPVYISHPDDIAPMLVERNWVPEWWFSLVATLFGLSCTVRSALDPTFEPLYPILISGEYLSENQQAA